MTRLQIDGKIVTLVVVPQPEESIWRLGLKSHSDVQIGSIAAGELDLGAVAAHESISLHEVHTGLLGARRRQLVDVALCLELSVELAFDVARLQVVPQSHLVAVESERVHGASELVVVSGDSS